MSSLSGGAFPWVMKNQSLLTMALSQGCLKRVPSYDSERWFTLLGDFMGGIQREAD
jgi:hypothetical protein